MVDVSKLSDILGSYIPGQLPVVINFGGMTRNPGRVSTLSGANPPAAIIEAGHDEVTVDGLRAALATHIPSAEVQLFIVDGDEYAYYAVGQVLRFRDRVWITAGAYISGST
jgi:hypothetical protein